MNHPNPFAMSMIFKYLPLFLILAHGVRADFVYHDSATTSSGEFSPGFSIGNLKNAGHDSPTDLDDAADSNVSYATANPPTGGFPVTITLDFVNAVDLNAFYLWNHSNKNGITASVESAARSVRSSAAPPRRPRRQGPTPHRHSTSARPTIKSVRSNS